MDFALPPLFFSPFLAAIGLGAMVKKDISAFSKSSSVIRDSTVSIHVAKFNQLICGSQVLVGDCFFLFLGVNN